MDKRGASGASKRVDGKSSLSDQQRRAMDANRRLWDELTAIHARSAFYDVEAFLRGERPLAPLERREVGDVAGKSLLHLQCHFGLDTLSWARLGATATGVDFSPKAIALARALSRQTGVKARFIRANVYDLPRVLDGSFDIVFTSYGVLCWLPDLKPWAQVVSHFLKPGGTFYIVDFHPITNLFSNDDGERELRLTRWYFHRTDPEVDQMAGSYADKSARVASPTHEWTHTLGDVVSAVSSAGLRIQFLHEFPYCAYQHFPFLRRGADGWWRLPGRKASIPLMFSIRATK
jgi:SAM-dependent methyltransferase